MTRMRVAPGRDRPSAPSRALTARVKSSYLPTALNSATRAGTAPGQVTGRTLRPEGTGAVRAGGRLAVARASIQAVEATGPVKPLIEPDTSQATPTARGGAGTRRRSTLVKGFEVGIAPAARCASAAIACRIRSRPGGVAEAITVSARPPALD